MSETAPTGAPAKLRELFGIDGRSLAVYRIGLGLVFLADLLKRCITFRAHYTEEGLFPREVARETMGSSLFNAFLLTDDPSFTKLLMVVMGVCAVCISLGYRTRVATIVFAFLLVSLNRRNIWILHTGDVFLYANALWACFLPLSNRWSLDARRHRARGLPPPGGAHEMCLSVGTVAILVQIALFYAGAGFLKLDYEVWTKGEAMWVFARIEEYTRPFGTWLGSLEGPARFLTYGTLFLECGGPFLFFSPWLTRYFRTVLTLLFMGFHLGIQLTVYIGVFEVVSMIAVAVFLPSWFWNRVVPKVPGLRLLERLDRVDEPARRKTPSSKKRGKGEAAVTPSFPTLTKRLELGWQGMAAVLLALVVITNSCSLARRSVPEVLDRTTMRDLALIQHWSIFSNIEPLFRGWFVVIGQQNDGELVDVLQNEPFGELRKPEHFAADFPNHNMRRYWVNMSKQSNAWLRPYLADYLIRDWNERNTRPIERLLLAHVGRAGQQTEDQITPMIAYDPVHFAAQRRGVPLPAQTEQDLSSGRSGTSFSSPCLQGVEDVKRCEALPLGDGVRVPHCSSMAANSVATSSPSRSASRRSR